MLEELAARRHRLRRRHRDAGAGGRREVRAVVRRAARRRARQARRAGRGVSAVTGTEIVERIWARDPTLWTGHDEAEWLGWLDEPIRDARAIWTILALARRAGALRAGRPARHGRLEPRAGGAPALVRRRRVPRPRHDASRRDPPAQADSLDLGRTLFVASSKSGGTHRDAVASRLLLGAHGRRRHAVRRGHRPRLLARAARARAGLRRRRLRRSRRSAGATRRCRRSGSCPPS